MASESADLRALRTALVTAAARVAELRTWGFPMAAAESGRLDEKTRQLAQSLKDDYDALATHPLAAAVLQQEAGEPVAWQVWWGLIDMQPHWPPFKSRIEAYAHASSIKSKTEVRPLYTSPQAQVPLTDGQIDVLLHTKHFDKSYKLGASDKVCIDWYRLGLRDGERAHLIGLETKE